jgi:hypothetical protein
MAAESTTVPIDTGLASRREAQHKIIDFGVWNRRQCLLNCNEKFIRIRKSPSSQIALDN